MVSVAIEKVGLTPAVLSNPVSNVNVPAVLILMPFSARMAQPNLV